MTKSEQTPLESHYNAGAAAADQLIVGDLFSGALAVALAAGYTQPSPEKAGFMEGFCDRLYQRFPRGLPLDADGRLTHDPGYSHLPLAQTLAWILGVAGDVDKTPKPCRCTNCGGDGELLFAGLGSNDPLACWHICPVCGGIGKVKP